MTPCSKIKSGQMISKVALYQTAVKKGTNQNSTSQKSSKELTSKGGTISTAGSSNKASSLLKKPKPSNRLLAPGFSQTKPNGQNSVLFSPPQRLSKAQQPRVQQTLVASQSLKNLHLNKKEHSITDVNQSQVLPLAKKLQISASQTDILSQKSTKSGKENLYQ